MALTLQSNRLKDYIDIIQKVARVEYRRIPAHMVECEELVSIGIIAIQALIKNKSDEQLENIIHHTLQRLSAGQSEMNLETDINGTH